MGLVRDETWRVTSVEDTPDGPVRGPWRERLCKGRHRVLLDLSWHDPGCRAGGLADRRRHLAALLTLHLWFESTLRKTPAPASVGHAELAVSNLLLANDLPCQREATEMGLDTGWIRLRMPIADAVDLGEPLEVGMNLSGLIWRGPGQRILIVGPRHVLEQAQCQL